MKPYSIDINCDLGEGGSDSSLQHDASLMPFISSCNIACGGHAGNPRTMHATVQNAKTHRLKIGAHPSFPDQENFGRIAIKISAKDLRVSISEQLNSFAKICHHQQVKYHHVKPHGALYNLAAQDQELATLLAEEIAKISEDIIFMGLANSLMQDAAQKVGIAFWQEGFIDRLYHVNGHLVSRTHPMAVHKDVSTCLTQALQLAQQEAIMTLENQPLTIAADSLCLHGDNEQALTIAEQLFSFLKDNNITIA